jgi:hypothetical protein
MRLHIIYSSLHRIYSSLHIIYSIIMCMLSVCNYYGCQAVFLSGGERRLPMSTTV